jgi:superoxide dismutase, Cu-Zn family
MRKLWFLILAVLISGACAHAKRPMAMATLAPTSGQTASGTVHFNDVGDGNVEVVIDLTGVPPGVHGLHIHEKGDCGNNAQNAGGHFNPTGMVHGAPDAVSHHAGDFGNVTADANGEVHTRFTTHSISLIQGFSSSAIGHAVVLHEKADDLISQPSGNAGGRIACGVVESMQHM